MISFEMIAMAWSAITANKVRSLLSMLGIIIGVSTVIGVVGIGVGAQKQIAEQFKNLSATSIIVVPNRGTTIESRLSIDDVENVLKNSPFLVTGSASLSGNVTVAYSRESESVSLLGVDESFFDLANLELLSGRLFSPIDISMREKSVVLGFNIAETLFRAPLQSIGQTVTLNGRKMTVIGVLQSNGANSFGTSYDDSLYTPYTTAEKNILGQNARVRLTFLARHVDIIKLAEEDVSSILRELHGLRENQEDDFRVFDPGSIVASATQAAQIMSFVLTSVAAIVLLVSGIGIMNVMFVTVAERTKEIGIMKAIGARQYDILSQFLLEAIMLCVTGGVIGILLGQGIIKALQQFGAAYSLTGILIGFLFSLFVGLFFGFYPALKASRLDPVDALRSE